MESLWTVFWPGGVQHRRREGDLTAGMIDLQCCRVCWLGQIQKHLTHTHAVANTPSKPSKSIQTNIRDLSRVHNYAGPILDLTDMQIQIEEENTLE